MEYETKDATAPDGEINSAFSEFLSAFEEFKHANDERLAQLEKRNVDVVTEEKVDRINKALVEQKRALEELTLAAQRPHLAETKAIPVDGALERKAAFDRYVRKGDASGFDALETKALSAGSDPDGGYIVPVEIEKSIDRVLANASPMRTIASVRQVGAHTYKKPMTTIGAESGWVGETGARDQTDTPVLSIIAFPTMELYAMPAATQTLLDDAQVDIEQWLANEVQTEFVAQEGAAFVGGNGTTAPKGFLSETKVADASWTWTKLGYIASGADSAFASTDPADRLLDLAYAPKQAYRAHARWVLNCKTEAAIRKIKDSTGAYIWQPSIAAGQPATLLGYPVTEMEDMPPTSHPTAKRSRSVTFSAAILWSTASESALFAIPIRRSRMSSSTRRNESAAASRTSKPSS